MVGISPDQQQQRNLAALNRLIQMAHDRGLDFTVGIWDHIYRGGVQAGGVRRGRRGGSQADARTRLGRHQRQPASLHQGGVG